jgi:uncharacterized protein (TIGR02118 family)
MIKVIWAMHRRPDVSPDEFYRHWHQRHGLDLGAKVSGMRRYVQHHTLAEARDGQRPVPTHDGASIAWFDDLPQMFETFASPEWQAQSADARNIFANDADHQTGVVYAQERVVIDGQVTPAMVKMISLACKDPSISWDEFRDRWYAHGELCAKVPGQRRYVQNHPLREVYEGRVEVRLAPTHDGWAEHWFDDLQALRAGLASPEWKALSADSRGLFAPGKGATVVARETVIIP